MRILVGLSLFVVSASILYAQPKRDRVKKSKHHPDLVVEKIRESHDHEIAAEISLPLSTPVSFEKWKKCIPQESIPFPNELPHEILENTLSGREFEDLKNCSEKSCAFNFNLEERKELASSKNETFIRERFFSYFKKRTSGNVALNPNHKSLMILSNDGLFTSCASPVLDNLISSRPKGDFEFRLSHVKYGDLMRPTTRLSQGIHYQHQGTFCFAEAHIFADHYDAERIELWSYQAGKTSRLHLRIRNRLDFLHNWVRRLQKPALRDTLIKVAEQQLLDARSCLEG